MKDRIEDDENLSTLVDNFPGIIYRSSFEKKRTMRYLSENCVEITGYEPSKLIDNKELSWADLIHSEDEVKVRKEIKDALDEGDRFKVTYRITTKDGEERWVWEQGVAKKNSEGKVESLEGFITDITEEIETQSILKQRENKVKELYKASSRLERCRTRQEVFDLAVRYAKDILGFYACGIFIKEDDHLVGKKFTEKSVGKKGHPYPIDEGIKGLSFKKYEAILIKEASNWEDEIEAHQEGLKSSVTAPIGERGIFQAASKELGDYDEFDLEMAKILASHINESIERIESEKEKSLILDTAEEHIFYLDTDLNIKWANKETEDYADVEEISGKKCYKAVRGHDEPIENCPVKRAIQMGEQQEEIVRDGEKYWLSRATPRLNDEGEVTGIVEMCLDVTDRKVAENKLKENKEKIEGVLDATSKIENEFDPESIYEVAVDAAENILNIDMCAIFTEEDEDLVLKAESSGVPEDRPEKRDISVGVAGKTFKNKEPDITNHIPSSEDATLLLDGYKSGITVPIGDIGIFQAMSEKESCFDEDDLTILELLSTHVAEAIERSRLYEDLKESEERYKKLFEGSPISMWEEDFGELKDYLESLKDSGVHDLEEYFDDNPEETKKCIDLLKVKNVNQKTLELFEAEDREELDKNLDTVFGDEIDQVIKNEFAAIAEGQEAFETKEVVNYTLEGEKKHFYMKWTDLGEEGDYSNVLVSLVDITDLKDTQKKLRKSEERYRSIFESTGTAMIIIDEDGTISLANEEFAKLTGYSKDQIEEDMEWTKFVVEEDRVKMDEYHEKRREEPAGEVPSQYEFTMVNRFGDVKEIFVEVGMLPDSKKSVASLIDITDYKKTFGALRESQEAFRKLFENENIPIALINKEKNVKEANEATCHLFSVEEGGLTGRSFLEYIHPKDRDSCRDILETLLSGEKDSGKCEMKGLSDEEEEMSLKAKLDLIRDHKDDPLYLICTLQSL